MKRRRALVTVHELAALAALSTLVLFPPVAAGGGRVGVEFLQGRRAGGAGSQAKRRHTKAHPWTHTSESEAGRGSARLPPELRVARPLGFSSGSCHLAAARVERALTCACAGLLRSTRLPREERRGDASSSSLDSMTAAAGSEPSWLLDALERRQRERGYHGKNR